MKRRKEGRERLERCEGRGKWTYEWEEKEEEKEKIINALDVWKGKEKSR